jgi:hypothetical protein
MSNVIRFVTKNNKSKNQKIKSINSDCEIIIFPGIRYSWPEDAEVKDRKTAKRRSNSVKATIEPKRKRGT